jgi:endonuclease YncB( thermonuclease family)
VSPLVKPYNAPAARLLVAAQLAFAFTFGTLPAFAQAPRDLIGARFSARVVHIADGDTLEVADARSSRRTKIRLEGIDAPESGRAFSRDATNYLRIMLFDRNVVVEGRSVDRYRRLVARVFVDGKDSSIALVRAGLACHFTKYSSDPVLARAQQQAQADRQGFWIDRPPPSCLSRVAGIEIGPFRGNTQSKVYHTADCRNAACRNCTRVFQTVSDAQRAGYRPSKDCHH